MTLPVSLGDVVSEMDVMGDETVAYINRRTGELITITDYDREEAEEALEIEENPDFIALPSKFDIHEYSIMERFCASIGASDSPGGEFGASDSPGGEFCASDSPGGEFCASDSPGGELTDSGLQGELLSAIGGNGAFRNFRGVIRRSGIEQKWYDFRDQAFESIAVAFLEEHNIPYVSSEPSARGPGPMRLVEEAPETNDSPVATNPEREAELGRVALWLSPNDLSWLAAHCCCEESEDAASRERCGRIRSQANAALHDSGLRSTTELDDD